jgi:hypothetical protein
VRRRFAATVLLLLVLVACGRGEDRPGQVTSETKTTSNR